MQSIQPHFFRTAAAWRRWLEKHQADTRELWVGLYKRDSGRPSITWPEAVDGALCFGWIDGVRKSVDSDSYMIRFTPRKPGSVWSAVNLKRASALSAQGLMHPAGLAALAERNGDKSKTYSYEQRKAAKLPPDYERQFRKHALAWKYFQSQAPWYRRTSSWWVISAKKEETRRSRLATLIEYCGQGKAIPPLARPSKSKANANQQNS